ncbi:MAG: SxtJ family membrane protein [Planctomycetaceae bacterium]
MAVISINWKPSSRELRMFAALLMVFFASVAGIWNWKTGQAIGPIILVGVSWAIGSIGLVIPQAIRWFYVGWMVAVFPIGWTVSHILLAVIFFGVIMPIGLILRMLGRDPMRKGWDRSATSYWIARPTEPTDAQRYFRQF